ncbi:hypothetical protein [Stackebrandtia soli]|uniref:hypothetical protein n=1 Tax=Stackebrandtia soli TaxID=1892856 RepID=UPI0039E7A52C
MNRRSTAAVAVAATIATVGLDRLAVLLVELDGPDWAGGDAPVGERSGDVVDIALTSLAIVLIGWTWWTGRQRGRGALAASGAFAVAVVATLAIAAFFTPLRFALRPNPAGDDLTGGALTGPWWFAWGRPALLIVAAVAVVVAVATLTAPFEDAAVDRAPRSTTIATRVGLFLVWAALAVTVVVFLAVAQATGTSPLPGLLPACVAAAGAYVGTRLIAASGRLGVPVTRRERATVVATGALIPFWIVALGWLFWANPLVVEPSIVEYGLRESVEPWAGPLLVGGLAVGVVAPILALFGWRERDRSDRRTTR